MYMENSFIEQFRNKKIWIGWRWQKTSNGTTKVPFTLTGKHGSSTDSTTWSTYDEFYPHLSKFAGIGVVFENSQSVIGVDFDHCVKDGGISDQRIVDFITASGSYCEYSPSGTGVHVLFLASHTISLFGNKRPTSRPDLPLAEIYVSGRYFTFTGNEYALSRPVRPVDEHELTTLLQIIGYPWHEPSSPIASVPEGTNPMNDADILRKMFASKHGDTIKALYHGDIASYANDESSADMALCLHLAFWTRNDAPRMLALWLASPLGNRPKTKERKDYQQRTIAKAIELTSEVYTPPTVLSGDDDMYILSTGEHPVPLLVVENIARCIVRDETLKNKFRLNTFSHMVETCWDSDEWTNLYDAAILQVQRFICVNYAPFRKVSRPMITDAILAAAYENKVNPPKDYFMSLVWDGTPRLNGWLHAVYGVPDDDLHQAMGANWIKGIVKRVLRPGCIFDEVLALESKQGWRKSTSIRELGSPWHVETTHSMDDKDFHLIVAQNVIVEFSEGDVFDRSSVNKIKSEITKTEDQFRPPYERGILTFKRSCVFAVTTNKLELKDDTGNRRWLPVSLEKPADVDWIKANREQLYAEAYHRVAVRRETTHEYPREQLEELQASRGEFSDYDETVIAWYAELPLYMRDAGIQLKEATSVAYPSITPGKLEELRVASILRRLGLESKLKKVDGRVIRRWYPTEATARLVPNIPNVEPTSFL